MSFVDKLLAEKEWRYWFELVNAEMDRLRLVDEDKYVAFPSGAEYVNACWLGAPVPNNPITVHDVRTQWMIWCPRSAADRDRTDEMGRPVRRILHMSPMFHGAVQCVQFVDEDDALAFAALMNLGRATVKRSKEGGKEL